MKKGIYYLLLIIITLNSCNQIQQSKNKIESPDIDTEFYYDEERGIYALEKFDKDGIQTDTAFLYRDSLKKVLLELNTIIRLKNYPTINQIIHYKNGNIDISNSYYYSIDRIKKDSLKFQVYSQYNDTIYLEIGEIDSMYKNNGKVDSFPFVGNILVINNKSYYERARLGVWEKNERETYTGKELYVPKKYLIK